ncbi:hypothetical protein JHK82_028744 [Glycine max]|nr:hypothetical protein GLYMA_10G205167v4 [Glycine max]KAG5127909.1 hypothetical protein JHK82_028744 [Glycine max]KAH1139240.1 hypothetical protein GYH30_028606 [Glycine max]
MLQIVPTLADSLHADVTREIEVNINSNKRKKDGSTSCSLRKNRRSSIAGEGEEDKGGKTSRQLRKQAARKPANSSFNEDVEDNNDLDPPYNSNGDELQENDETMKLIIHPRKKEYQQVHRRNLWLKVEKHLESVRRLMMI